MGNAEVNKKIYVIMDTNMLLMHLVKYDIFEEISELLGYKPIFICPESVMKEIETISREKSEAGALALKVKEAIKDKCNIAGSNYDSADTDIISLAVGLSENGVVIVATNDRELRKRLKKANIKSIYYRESQDRLETDFNFWF